MILGIVLVTSYILYLYFREFRSSYIWFDKNGEVKKRLSVWTILKSTYEFLFVVKSEDRLSYFKLIHELSPRYLRMKFWKWDYVLVYDPELCKKIFNTQVTCQRPFRNCIQLEKGLMSSEYHYWKMSRKLLNGAFNLNILKGFIPIYNFYAGNVVNEMEKHAEDGKDFDVLVPLAKLTARSIAATILNVHGIEVSSYHKLIDSISIFLDLTFKRMLYPWLQYDFIYKLTKDYEREKVAREFAIKYGDELIAASREKKTKHLSYIDENGNVSEKRDMKVEYIIDQLLLHEDKFTNEEIREHILMILITASETSAKFVAMTLLFLAIHQDVQQKVYDEINEVFSNDTESIDYEQLNSCKYLEMVMKESLRLFTPLPITARETIDRFDLGIGEPLEKGATIFLFNYILHRRKDIWGEDANSFNPENFSPENLSKIDPYSFVPFGAGPRSCIGSRLALIGAKVETIKFIQAYKFNTKLKESDLKQGLSLTLMINVDYLVSIEKR